MEPTLGFGFETFYTNAALHASDGFMEAHWRTMDTFGAEHRHISYVAPWNGKRNRDVMSIASDQFNLLDFGRRPFGLCGKLKFMEHCGPPDAVHRAPRVLGFLHTTAPDRRQ